MASALFLSANDRKLDADVDAILTPSRSGTRWHPRQNRGDHIFRIHSLETGRWCAIRQLFGSGTHQTTAYCRALEGNRASVPEFPCPEDRSCREKRVSNGYRISRRSHDVSRSSNLNPRPWFAQRPQALLDVLGPQPRLDRWMSRFRQSYSYRRLQIDETPGSRKLLDLPCSEWIGRADPPFVVTSGRFRRRDEL